MDTLYSLLLAALGLIGALVPTLVSGLRGAAERAAARAAAQAAEKAAIERNLEECCRSPIAQKQTQRSEFPRKDAHSSPATRPRRAG